MPDTDLPIPSLFLPNPRLIKGPGTFVRARAPLRLGFAGGGTDVSPYADLFGGAVMNATISHHVYATIEWLHDKHAVFESHDLQLRACYPAGGELPMDGTLDLAKAVYNRVCRDFLGGRGLPLRIATQSEAPAGTGLGSSSTLVVAILQGLAELLGLPLSEYDLAHLAFVIERQDMALQGGRQDQYAAVFGGFNFMEFRGKDEVIVNPLRIKASVINELQAQTVLCFVGVSRESATIIQEQARNVSAGAAKPIEAMHRVKAAAMEMKEALLRGDLDALAATLSSGWASKRETAAGISTSRIECAMELALRSGARAGKVSGAGGGGVIMLLAPVERRHQLMATLAAAGYRVETCHYSAEGATAWRI